MSNAIRKLTQRAFAKWDAEWDSDIANEQLKREFDASPLPSFSTFKIDGIRREQNKVFVDGHWPRNGDRTVAACITLDATAINSEIQPFVVFHPDPDDRVVTVLGWRALIIVGQPHMWPLRLITDGPTQSIRRVHGPPKTTPSTHKAPSLKTSPRAA